MFRFGARILPGRHALLPTFCNQKSIVRPLTNLKYKIDRGFRDRMLALETKGKAGRFYVIDPPAAGEQALYSSFSLSSVEEKFLMCLNNGSKFVLEVHLSIIIDG